MSMTLTLLNDAVAQAPALNAAAPAASVTDTGTNILTEFRALILLATGVVAVMIILIAVWRTKTLVGGLSGLAVGVLLVWGAANVTSPTVQNPIREQLNSGNG